MLYSCQDKWVDKCVYFSGFWSWEELDTWVQITKTKSCSLVTTRKHLILKLNWMFLSSFLSHKQRFYCLPFLATLHQAETTSWQLEEVQRKIAIATQLTPSEKQWDIFTRWYLTIWELWNTFFALSLILMPTCTHTHTSIHPPIKILARAVLSNSTPQAETFPLLYHHGVLSEGRTRCFPGRK